MNNRAKTAKEIIAQEERILRYFRKTRFIKATTIKHIEHYNKIKDIADRYLRNIVKHIEGKTGKYSSTKIDQRVSKWIYAAPDSNDTA